MYSKFSWFLERWPHLASLEGVGVSSRQTLGCNEQKQANVFTHFVLAMEQNGGFIIWYHILLHPSNLASEPASNKQANKHIIILFRPLLLPNASGSTKLQPS